MLATLEWKEEGENEEEGFHDWYKLTGGKEKPTPGSVGFEIPVGCGD